MRALVPLALLLLGGCLSAPQPPQVVAPKPLPQLAGTLAADRELAGEVVLADDLRIPAGKVLRLRAGTVVRVRPSESTKIDPEYLSPLTEILVQGRLEIDGTAEQPVRFELLDPFEPVAGDEPLWAGFAVLPGGEIELYHAALSRAETGVLAAGGRVLVTGLRLRDSRYGLVVQDQGRLELRETLVSGGETGVFCWGGGTLELRQTRLERFDEEALLLGEGCRSKLVGVTLADSAVGIAAFGPSETGIEFTGNRVDVRPLFGGYP